MAGLFFKSGIDKGFERDLRRMNKLLNSFSKDAKKQTGQIDKGFQSIGNTLRDLAAIGGFAAVSTELLDLTNNTFKYRKELSKLTNLQGAELNNFTASLTGSANTFGKEVNKMSLAVTNFAKGMDISFEESLALVDKGFVKGADGSNEFLDSLREYSPLLKEAGLSAQQSIELMTQQVKQGVYSDKGVDTIKEGNLRLREMTEATKKALDGIGISSSELQKALQDGTITTFQAIQKVSNKIAELPASSAKVGTAIADIFGGPGEDAGLEFIKTLGKLDEEFTKIDKNLSTAVSQEQELLKVNQQLQKAFSDLLGDRNPLTVLAISAKEALIFLIENKEVILTLVAAMAGWRVGLALTNKLVKANSFFVQQSIKANKLSVLTGKQVTAANLLMAKSFKTLRLVISSNPIGLLITGLTIAIPLISSFFGETDKATDSQAKFNEELEKSKQLLSDYQKIQKKQAVAGGLSTESLQEQKRSIEQQIKSQKEALLEVNNELEKNVSAGRKLYLESDKIQRENQLKNLQEYLTKTEKLLSEQPKVIAEKSKKQQEDERNNALKLLEVQNQERRNALLRQYGWQLDKQEELNQKLLQSDLQYLQEKRKLTVNELEKLRIDQQIIQAKAADASAISIKPIAGKVQAQKAPISEVQEINNQVKELEKRIIKVNIANKTTNKGFGETIEVFNGVNEIMNTLVNSFDGVDSTVSNILQGVAGTAQGLMGMANGIKSVTAATTALEKASGILAIVSATIQLSNAISGAFNKVSEERNKAHVRELQQVHEVNMALLDQNKLYKEGNELLASDAWGTALRGLETYNKALEFQKQITGDIATQGTQADSTLQGDIFKTILDPLTGPLSILGGRNERKQLESIREQAQAYTTELEKGLAVIAVKTKEASKFGSFFGQADQYQSLLELYPQLIDASGELDTNILQTVIDTENLADVDKERLTQLIDLTEQAQAAYEQFGDYISGIFGSVADDVTQAFQTMYESGQDAMLLLEDSMSDMIENFTRDIIEFSLLQPLVSEVNEAAKSLGEEYAKGGITSEELQENIVSTLGDFYNSLNTIQPEILQAYENADRLAEQAGFERAFAGDSVTAITDTSRAGQVQRAISEETGSELVGRLGALMLSNQEIYNNSVEMLDLAVANLVTLNKIKANTDYLPTIADNTKKTYEKLSNL